MRFWSYQREEETMTTRELLRRIVPSSAVYSVNCFSPGRLGGACNTARDIATRPGGPLVALSTAGQL
jgi:hypothetical protein